jgi:Sec-independent protein secretion pathway component TatC
LFDVITSPILITIRIIRHFIGDWFVGGLKRIIKSVVHWFAHKREYRLEHGHGIFRTYWYLILTSPIIFFILFILLAMITGIAQDLPEMLELLLRGCQEGSQYWCNTDLW